MTEILLDLGNKSIFRLGPKSIMKRENYIKKTFYVLTYTVRSEVEFEHS